jgi:HK97 family phage major capsid protein
MSYKDTASQGKAKLDQIDRIQEAANSAGRELTAAETEQCNELLADAVAFRHRAEREQLAEGLDDRLRGLGDGERWAENVDRFVPTRTHELADGWGQWGARKLIHHSERSLTAGWAKALEATVGNAASYHGLTTSGTINVPSPVLGAVRDPERPRFVADLLPAVSVSGSVAPYFRQSARTNAAAPVVTGVDKPESSYSIDRKESAIETIAHIVDDVNRADLSDGAFLQQFIESEMMYGLRLAIDNQVMNGTGTPPQLRGILQDTGIQTQTFATDIITSLRKGLTKLQMENFEPNGGRAAPDGRGGARPRQGRGAALLLCRPSGRGSLPGVVRARRRHPGDRAGLGPDGRLQPGRPVRPRGRADRLDGSARVRQEHGHLPL